jgi:hypothetical protein
MNKLKLVIRVLTSVMLLAFIFGIVAFVKASKNGELNTLYKEERIVVKDSIKDIDVEDFSRGKIYTESTAPDSISNIKVDSIAVIKPNSEASTQKKAITKKYKKEKRQLKSKGETKFISVKSFSRGSLEKRTIKLEEKTTPQK